jgi:hypothetical protein
VQVERAVPEIIDPVFAKTSPKCSFCMTENGRFGFVFMKTGSINSGPGAKYLLKAPLRCKNRIRITTDTEEPFSQDECVCIRV